MIRKSRRGTVLNTKKTQKQKGPDRFAVAVGVCQIIIIILFGVFVQKPEEQVLGDSFALPDFGVAYNMFSGVLVMMLIGFG